MINKARKLDEIRVATPLKANRQEIVSSINSRFGKPELTLDRVESFSTNWDRNDDQIEMYCTDTCQVIFRTASYRMKFQDDRAVHEKAAAQKPRSP